MRRSRRGVSGTVRATCDLEALEGLIEELREASDGGAAIIVEGIKDRRSLRELGIDGTIITAAGRPALEVAEDAAQNFGEIIVLTDWDRAGEEEARRMEKHLLCTRAHADLRIRDRLKKMVRREIKDVESLSRYVQRMRAEACPSGWL
ncbi:MAG: toprim domain-containing protein [Methanotrichaceae archaeon]